MGKTACAGTPRARVDTDGESRGRATLTVVRPPRPARLDREEAIARDVRTWLARELHDVVLQRLTGMVVDIECMKRDQYGRSLTLEQLDELKVQTRDALDSLRAIVSDLRDDHVLGHGLVDSVRVLGERFQARTGIVVRLDLHSWPSRLSPQLGLHLRRIVEEALNNVRFHSGARSVDIRLERDGGWLCVTIADDGCGRALDVERSARMGILGMRERATLLGGRLVVRDRRHGGLALELRVPAEARM
jgi:two-component system, NarL family, sensor histidine kinase UhpB